MLLISMASGWPGRVCATENLTLEEGEIVRDGGHGVECLQNGLGVRFPA